MSADFIINTEHKVVFSCAWGALTFADLIDHRIRLRQDTRFAEDFRQIADLTQVTDLKLSSAEIYSLAQEPVFLSHSRRALVAASSTQFGLSRMFHAYSNKQNIGVFHRLEEAAEWLELPIDVSVKTLAEIRHAHGLA